MLKRLFPPASGELEWHKPCDSSEPGRTGVASSSDAGDRDTATVQGQAVSSGWRGTDSSRVMGSTVSCMQAASAGVEDDRVTSGQHCSSSGRDAKVQHYWWICSL